MKNNSFCAFILSHGRPNGVKTYETLRRQGYTGKIRIVVDDEDKSIGEYRKRFKDEVIVFSKDEAAKLCDPMDNLGNRGTPLFARNMLWTIAKNEGCDYFVELDDDYSEFLFKFTRERDYIGRIKIADLDGVFDVMVDFLKSTPTTVIAAAQGGDYIGGPAAMFGKKIFLRRKTMNVFFCKTDRPFYFYGTLNDDVNSYIKNGNVGILHFTNNLVCVQQGATQQNKGGITELYLKVGTYNKSFYTVMISPTSAKISTLGPSDPRVHHKILWKYAVPKIVSEKYRKK